MQLKFDLNHQGVLIGIVTIVTFLSGGAGNVVSAYLRTDLVTKVEFKEKTAEIKDDFNMKCEQIREDHASLEMRVNGHIDSLMIHLPHAGYFFPNQDKSNGN